MKKHSRASTTPVGTIRIGKDLKVYERKSNGWKVYKKILPEAFDVIHLFRKNKKFEELIDKKNPKFLKGQLSPEGKPFGARVNVLPDGKKLDGAFSLFSPGLTIHDQLTHSHWDVIYKNPNGKFAYHYTLEKKSKAVENKFKTVKTFEKKFPKLEKQVLESLENKKDYMALPLYTLLETHMRVGNEIYYRAHGHKGLSTLKKSDATIKGDKVTFGFFGKDGVPQKITKTFPKIYIKRLKETLKTKKNDDFIFTKPNGKLLHENDFKKTFRKYIGSGFYPHIVRSFFATKETQEFLKKHKKPKKEEVKSFLTSVAEELGHKKFSKKTGNWEDSYTVTIGHYIDPKLSERMRDLIK